MKKSVIIWIVILVAVLITASIIYSYFNSSEERGLSAAKPGTGCTSNGYECGDCIDNDGDGLIDYKVNKKGVITGDPQCTSLTDDCESVSCCTPNCAGKNCGSDGCGGSCGTCQNGYTCTNGNCVISISDSCSDGDGGIVPQINSTISGYLGGNFYIYPDYCMNNLILVERYCSGNLAYSTNITCSDDYTSCSSGKCV